MEKSLSEQLADNLAYYVNDPKKRCVNDTSCYYSGETAKKDSEGCFVGRLLSAKDRLKADENCVGSVGSLIIQAKDFGIKLPKVIKENRLLMIEFQGFHDDKDNWSETGLSNQGKAILIDIIKRYNLEVKYFEKFLVVTE
jgi:hypothetical protein